MAIEKRSNHIVKVVAKAMPKLQVYADSVFCSDIVVYGQMQTHRHLCQMSAIVILGVAIPVALVVAGSPRMPPRKG